MADELSNDEKIELGVRRVLSEREVDDRNSIIEELEKHRNYLQSQFRTFTLGLSALAIVGSSLFVFFFSKSFRSLEDDITAQIDTKVIEYKIIESLRSNLEQQLSVVAESDTIKERIKVVADRVLTSQVDSTIVPLITRLIDSQISDLNQANLSSLLDRSVKSVVSWSELGAGDNSVFDQSCDYKFVIPNGPPTMGTYYFSKVTDSYLRSWNPELFYVQHDIKDQISFGGRSVHKGKLFKRCPK
ncbi:hypothetical protein C7B76_32060 [filamentous cyanobacterium CCP2]|nr:hypothetical protein C7B76_32060 [filamentous cyanobacterium CCP2]